MAHRMAGIVDLPQHIDAVNNAVSRRFTSSLALPSQDEAECPALVLSHNPLSCDDIDRIVGLEAEQAQRRQELREYLVAVKGRQEASSDTACQPRFGLEFYNLVQRLSQNQKAEYTSIRGWLPTLSGLTSPMPLASSSDDPRVQEGLQQILQLDEKLMKKSAKAALVARETFPEKWEAQDQRQAERDEKMLLQSIERGAASARSLVNAVLGGRFHTVLSGRERLRQQRVNRLASAVEALDHDPVQDSDASPILAGHFRRALLTPADEQLLKALLAQDEDEAWKYNPFDCAAMTSADDGSDLANESRLADLDAKLEAYHMDDLQSNAGDTSTSRSSNCADLLEPRPPTADSSSSMLTTRNSEFEKASAEQSVNEMLLEDDTQDWLTAKRQARQIATRVEDIDAKLRRLQTAEFPKAPTKEQMAVLIHSCQRQLNQQLKTSSGIVSSCASPVVC